MQWLFLDKKLGHWKSTRATAEAIYALVHYLERTGTLGAREEATVTVGPRRESFVFDPDRYTGRSARLVVHGPDARPRRDVDGGGGEDDPRPALRLGHLALLDRAAAGPGRRRPLRRLPALLQARAAGERVGAGAARRGRAARPRRPGRGPALPHAPGTPPSTSTSATPRGAGFEPESLTSGYHWDLGIVWYEAVRDSGSDFFFERLPAGEYTFKVRLRANVAGTFKVAPATVQSMYAPEFAAYSAGAVLTVAGAPPANR